MWNLRIDSGLIKQIYLHELHKITSSFSSYVPKNGLCVKTKFVSNYHINIPLPLFPFSKFQNETLVFFITSNLLLFQTHELICIHNLQTLMYWVKIIKNIELISNFSWNLTHRSSQTRTRIREARKFLKILHASFMLHSIPIG